MNTVIYRITKPIKPPLPKPIKPPLPLEYTYFIPISILLNSPPKYFFTM